MTDIKEVANSLGRAIRKTKEEQTKADPVNNQLYIYMHVMRAGFHHSDVILFATDRDDALNALKIAASGMDADYVGFTFEGWHAEETINPDTGAEWGPGEMGAYVEKHGRGGIVGEGITTFVMNRQCESAWVVQHFHQRDHQIEWIDYDVIAEYDKVDGYIPGAIKKIMSEPKLSDLIPDVVNQGVFESLGAERKQFHQDMAALSIISDKNLILGALLQAEEGSLRQQLIKDRFE